MHSFKSRPTRRAPGSLRRHVLAAAGCIALFAGLPLHAQDRYPTRPIKLIVPTPAGGTSDIFARAVAERLAKDLGQPVVVDNRAGASLMVGTAAVARAEPDGYTLLFTSSSPIVVIPYTMANVPYDVSRDFTAVSNLATMPTVLYVNASSGITNVKQLFDAARANPSTANYGSVGIGSALHVFGEYLIKQAGVKMVHVPYKGAVAQLQELAGGQLMAGTADISSATALVKAGKIRPIGVTGSARSPLLPGVPTFDEQGIAGTDTFGGWFSVFAPRGTPKPIVDQLAASLSRFVQTPEMREKLATFGAEPTGTDAAQANEFTRVQLARWKQVITRDLSDLKFD